MNNHFPIIYKGNKRNECENIINNIDFVGKKNIVECFAGSSAISFAIWRKHGNIFNYYINDIDEKLIEMYNLIKNVDVEEIEENVNRVRKEVFNETDKRGYYRKIWENNRDIYDYIFVNKYSTMGISYMCGENRLHSPYKLKPLQKEFIKFLQSENVFITNNDYTKLYEEHKNNKKSIIIIDPPYVNTDKRFYKSNDCNTYTYFSNNCISKNKASTYVIVDDNWIMRIIFKNCNILSIYDKRYEIRHNKVSHIIFSNK